VRVICRILMYDRTVTRARRLLLWARRLLSMLLFNAFNADLKGVYLLRARRLLLRARRLSINAADRCRLTMVVAHFRQDSGKIWCSLQARFGQDLGKKTFNLCCWSVQTYNEHSSAMPFCDAQAPWFGGYNSSLNVWTAFSPQARMLQCWSWGLFAILIAAVGADLCFGHFISTTYRIQRRPQRPTPPLRWRL
jgi:hypothetical protein